MSPMPPPTQTAAGPSTQSSRPRVACSADSGHARPDGCTAPAHTHPTAAVVERYGLDPGTGLTRMTFTSAHRFVPMR